MKALAKAISLIFMPLLMPTYGMLLLMNLPPYSMPSFTAYRKFVVLSTLVLTCLWPVLYMVVQKWKGSIPDLQLDDRKLRTKPYLFTLLAYLIWGYLMWTKLHMPDFMAAVMFGASGSLLVVILVNFFWKISAHLTGWGGFMGGVFGICFQFGINPVGLLSLLCVLTGLLMWARLYMNAHTPIQTVAGLYLGFACTFIPCILF